ncbi:HAD family hydrolase [Ferribacterium limneticum]|uniref:HAD family hydrolase n=1 Tax=Ferribacterium limneticum TaxID=76259 RepID=UPI001CFB2E17|nr:HAD-IA family hydrolase [Ferribacterium limneticum]UCV30150.1 HAD-IA family hydrolase [Ferribacterium limneticum]UCV34069.1 HAD-IA family hydrolase [Ferribacterium limneticum]
MKYELIVFDWDGTLLDSAGAIVQAIQAACRDLDLAVPDDNRARHVIGLGLVDALRHAVPELMPDRYQAMVDRYRYHYLAGDHRLTLFSGVPQMLERLHAAGHILAVATGKSRAGLERALDHSGLRPLFQASRCADECHSKPHPQMLAELTAEFGIANESTVMIGDTSHDLLMASNAGVDSLAVTYGAHAHDHLTEYKPVACLHSVGELDLWLRDFA